MKKMEVEDQNSKELAEMRQKKDQVHAKVEDLHREISALKEKAITI